MLNHCILQDEFNGIIEGTYRQITSNNPLITPFVGGVFGRIKAQLMLSVKAGSMPQNYTISFSYNDYISRINGVRTFRDKCDVSNKTIADVNDCFKYYCGLDDILWETKDCRLREEVFGYISAIFNSQVNLSNTILNSESESFDVAVVNEFKDYNNAVDKMSVITVKRFELYKYLEKNKLMNGMISKIILDSFIDSTHIMEDILEKKIGRIFEKR